MDDQSQDLNSVRYEIDASDYSRLLCRVLNVLDMAIPNKQAHQAAVHTVREAFDSTYMSMLSLTYPNSDFAQAVDGGYMVSPRH